MSRTVKLIIIIILIATIMLSMVVLKRQRQSTPNHPILASGFIPVYYDDVNKVWKKADATNKNNNWYDYDRGIWANAVMVNKEKQDKKLSQTREFYQQASVDTIILYSDILAFYVWIPRYKYQLFNSKYNVEEEQVINIKFEKGIQSTGTVKCQTNDIGKETCVNNSDGNWYTHPSFTFGNDELEGIWVGKFETTGTKENPQILPNAISLTNQSVFEFFAISQLFSQETYLDASNDIVIDAHMMKNSEWGAVAYLSQSKYGRCSSNHCEEIYQNNSMGITGRSKGSPATNLKENDEDQTNYYLSLFGNYTYDDRTVLENGIVSDYLKNNLGSKSSTTANIYGIYDMVGGANEYTMAFAHDQKETINIDKKYYDIYAYNNSNTNFIKTKLGDATGETRGWYDDKQCTINTNNYFTKRGCSSVGAAKSGLFYFCANDGKKYSHITFRSVIAIKEN